MRQTRRLGLWVRDGKDKLAVFPLYTAHDDISAMQVDDDEIPHIFDRFYKTDKSRSRDKGGAGLGLHIVRSIINLHGGDIIVRSVEGEYRCHRPNS